MFLKCVREKRIPLGCENAKRKGFKAACIAFRKYENKFGSYRKERFRNGEHREVFEERHSGISEEVGVHLTVDYEQSRTGIPHVGGIRVSWMRKYFSIRTDRPAY